MMDIVKIPGSDQSVAERIVQIVRQMKTFETMADNEHNRTHLRQLQEEVDGLFESLSEDEREQAVKDIEELGREHDRTVKELEETQALAKKQFTAAVKGEDVTCSCGKVTCPAFRLYRCYYCGVYHCEVCAAEHFGMTREEHNAKNYEHYMVPR